MNRDLELKLKPRLYLAGKVSKDDWRHKLVPGLRTHIWWGRNVIPTGQFDYVGPLLYSCDHGCSHGSNKHGVLASCRLGSLLDENKAVERSDIFQRCMVGIQQCDLVVAYITSVDAYGTFFEIGYASSLGKPIVLCFAPNVDPSDFWFHEQAATRTYYGVREPCLAEIVKREVAAIRRCV